MISIVVSSYQKHYFEAFSKNVSETIGVPYEIIQIWNPGLMGICKAYNQGAYQSKFENLLFVHEDVLFETHDWGKILIDYLQIENIGCVGVAGANYIPNSPSPWWVIEGYANSHLSHFNNKTNKRHDYTFESKEDGIKKSKILDGVFLACQKKVWNQVKFNEDLKGFHGYDIAFSIAVNNIKQNYIQNKITIIHYSAGNLSKEWLKYVIKAYSYSDRGQFEIDKRLELNCFKHFADQLRHFQFTKSEKKQYLSKFISFKHLGLINWLKAKRKINLVIRYHGK